LKYLFKNSICKSIGFLLIGSISVFASNNINGAAIVDSKCATCHQGSVEKGLSRISDQRKTPEAWLMTILRMERSNGLQLTKEERSEIVEYLSNTQGITPSESKVYRYILEQKPNMQEAEHEALFTQMCVRCHSAARVGLQRRTINEWDKLVDFHVGYFPTIEYHALSRDRDWYSVAKEKIVPFLAKKFPLDKNTWEQWEQSSSNIQIDGTWIVSGHTLAKGDFSALMSLSKQINGSYLLDINGKYINGKEIQGSGKATLYSGHELRATLTIDGTKFNQVISIDKQNNSFEGRMFEVVHPEEGSMIKGLYTKSLMSSILSVSPKSLKTGTITTLTIIGNNLNGKINLPQGVSIKEIIKSDKYKIILSVYTSKNSKTNVGNISIGNLVAKNILTTYTSVDSIKVEPSYAIARVGDGGGKTPKQHAIFEAYGFNSGLDGKIGTKDDIALGVVNSTWSIEGFDDIAKADKDTLFAGKIDSSNGRFTPSFAGLNPKRKFSTNNAGNLKVIASHNDAGKTVKGQSHMIVTIQRWVNPPIN
jgi:quinohemoprotein amine dehydrogenase